MLSADLFVGPHSIRFGTKLYKQVVEIPLGTNCAPLVANSFMFVMGGTLYIYKILSNLYNSLDKNGKF